MNKTIKNLSLAALALTGLAMMTVSCNKDEINALNDRVAKVESALTELQTQITEGAVITDVTSTEKGVTVTLSDGSSFTLTNGADGADGSVVSIGENGNWFIDGVDTGLPSRGADGQDGQDGADGADGQDGQDGADAPTVYYYPGEDGTFVKVTIAADGSKTEEPTEISYLVAGVVTAVWDTENGELILYNVEGAEDGKVVISLDGTLKSLAFVPEVIKDGYGLLEALYLNREVKPGEYQFLASNKVQALYRVNPANADLEGVEFSFIGRKVETRAAGDDADVFSGVLVDSEDGLLFDVNANEILDLKAGESYLVALKASFDGEEIVSDYARYEQDYVHAEDVRLINRQGYDKEKPEIEEFYHPADEEDMPALSDEPHMYITYGEELNVKESVVTYVDDLNYGKSLEDLGFDNVEYRITLPEEYIEDQTNVNQNACVNLSEDGVMTVKEGTSNVGKTPVVKAEAYIMVDGKEEVLATAYIKIEVVDEDVVDEPEEPRSLIELDFGTVEYSELSATAQKEYSKTLTATEFNSKVLDVLGLTPEEFANAYNSGLGYLTEDDMEAWIENGILLNDSKDLPSTMDWTGGNTYTFSLTDAAKYGEGPVDIALTITPKNEKTAPVIVLHVKFNIVHDLDACWPAFDPSYVVNDEAKVKGVMENGAWVLRAALSEHFEDASEAADIAFSLPKLNDKGEVDEKNGKTQEGAVLSGSDVNATISCSLELSKDRTYVVMMTRKHNNGQEHSKLYKVTFMVPFQTSVEPVVLTDSREAVSEDITKGIVLKESVGTEVVYKNGKAVDKNSYGFTDASFQITTALAKDQEAVEGLEIAGNTVIWKNEGTLLQAPKTVNLVVSVKIAGIYVSETPVTVTINPVE